MAAKKVKGRKISKSKKVTKKKSKKISRKKPLKKAAKKSVHKKPSKATKVRMVEKEKYDRLKSDLDKIKSDYAECLWAFVQWCGVAFNYIGEELGEEEVKKYSEYIAEHFARPMFEKGGVETLRTLKWFVDVLGSDFKLVEDDEKIVLTGTCNSGGRLEREGISKRNKEGVSYYCSHCMHWYEELAKKWYDLDIKFSYKPGGRGCTFEFMK